jgi:hypothetical protein
MGQYRQWLHYHEIDQQLQEQHAMLERALAQLQEHVYQIESDAALATPTPNNVIFQALSTHFQLTQQRPDTGRLLHELIRSATQPTIGKTENHLPTDTDTNTFTDITPTTNSSFTPGHREQTDPQLKVPRWLRNMRNTADQSESNPIDQQSQRTNRLVERWFERWKDTTLMKDAQQNRTEKNQQEDQPR